MTTQTKFNKFQAVVEDNRKAGIIAAYAIITVLVIGLVLSLCGFIHVPLY